jgi:hypothetical protein
LLGKATGGHAALQIGWLSMGEQDVARLGRPVRASWRG